MIPKSNKIKLSFVKSHKLQLATSQSTLHPPPVVPPTIQNHDEPVHISQDVTNSSKPNSLQPEPQKQLQEKVSIDETEKTQIPLVEKPDPENEKKSAYKKETVENVALTTNIWKCFDCSLIALQSTAEQLKSVRTILNDNGFTDDQIRDRMKQSHKKWFENFVSEIEWMREKMIEIEYIMQKKQHALNFFI